MNDNDNNILIAQQGNCDVALVNGSKVLHYKDASGNDQSLDIADLVNLTDGTGLFTNNKNLNVDWEISLPNLTDGTDMFYGSNLASFSGELPNLNKVYKGSGSGIIISNTGMFQNCTALTSFSSDLPNLSDGSNMFTGCTGLVSFSGELPNLSKAGGELVTRLNGMFYCCSALASWTVELPNLTDGSYMFSGCTALTSWTVDLPNLSNGSNMFGGCGGLASFSGDLSGLESSFMMFGSCTALTSWNVPLPNLTNGGCMFYGCTALTSFTGDLSNLTDGTGMFDGCKLDKASVRRIAESIPVSSGSNLTLGIDASLENDVDVAADLETIRTTKGWALTTEWN